MRMCLLLLLVVCLAGCGGFGRHADLVVGDRDAAEAIAPGSLRVTYLGCNGYLLESSDAAVLVDPYFSRVGLFRVGLGMEIAPRRERIDAALEQFDRPELRQKLRAVLVTHGHFDHLMDVPILLRELDTPMVGSPTSGFLARSAGSAAEMTVPMESGDARAWPGVIVRALEATHDRVLSDEVPYDGRLDAVPEHAPRRAEDWLAGRPLAFLVEIQGLRVYIDSGGRGSAPPPGQIGPVDLAIVGVATEDSRERLPGLMQRLRPRYVLPSHQDDFFKPLSEGFHFGQLADMDAVRRSHDEMEAGGRLILLDFFQPWTLSPAAGSSAEPEQGHDGA